MKNKLLYGLIGVLVLFSLFNTVSNIQNSSSLTNIRSTIESIPKDPVVYVGKDGKTPQLGIDYFLPNDGKNGVNSISFVTSETITKEVPIIGSPGESAYDTWIRVGNEGSEEDFIESLKTTQDIRVNTETKDIETRASNQRFYLVLVPCKDYRQDCP